MRSPFARVPHVAGLLIVAVALSAGLAYARFTPGDNAGATQLVTGSISGIVTNQRTGMPIAGAGVVANNVVCCGQGYGSTTAAADGSYTIEDLPPGDYRVGASAAGYVSSPIALVVAVASGETTANVNFSLVTDSLIMGRVTSQFTGLPISNAFVYAYSNDPCCDDGYTGAAGDGSYTITGLRQGNYWVRASAPGYLDEYFDNSYIGGILTLVGVTEGQTTVGVDFTLGTAGSISGTVTDEVTGLAIVGARVGASRTSGGDGGVATTAADGSYTITQLTPGDHLISVEASGYRGEYFNNTIDSSSATLVAVSEGVTFGGVNFALTRLGAISGIVTDEVTGLPIAGAVVYADGVGGLRGTDTAADGSFIITGLTQGTWRVRAYASGFREEYFDNAYDYAAATPISVIEAATVGDINIALAHLARISGTVTDSATGLPIAGAPVYASRIIPTGGSGGYATTAGDGAYTITNLQPGSYEIHAYGAGRVDEYFDNEFDPTAATLITVTDGATAGIDFALGGAGSISGTVTDQATGLPIAGAFMYASSATCCRSGYATTAADGSYTITNLAPLSYRVNAQASGYFSEYFGGYGVATLVSVIEGTITSGVNVALGSGGSISGTVTDQATGLPIAGANVQASEVPCCYINGSATTAANGSYTITGLRSGNYHMTSSASGYAWEYFNNAYDAGAATLVAVADGVLAYGINFALDPVVAPMDTDGDGCPDVTELAHQGVKEPDNYLDRSDYPNFDGDGRVDFDDFMMFARVYGTLASAGALNQRADLDSDGFVDFEDFVIFAAAYGRRCL